MGVYVYVCVFALYNRIALLPVAPGAGRPALAPPVHQDTKNTPKKKKKKSLGKRPGYGWIFAAIAVTPA